MSEVSVPVRSVSRRTPLYLSRRESEALDILYRCGSATAAWVLQNCTDPRSYSTVRTQLRVLELKGHINVRSVAATTCIRLQFPDD